MKRCLIGCGWVLLLPFGARFYYLMLARFFTATGMTEINTDSLAGLFTVITAVGATMAVLFGLVFTGAQGGQK